MRFHRQPDAVWEQTRHNVANVEHRTADQIDALLLGRLIEFWALPADVQREVDRERWLPTEEMYDLYLAARREARMTEHERRQADRRIA